MFIFNFSCSTMTKTRIFDCFISCTSSPYHTLEYTCITPAYLQWSRHSQILKKVHRFLVQIILLLCILYVFYR